MNRIISLGLMRPTGPAAAAGLRGGRHDESQSVVRVRPGRLEWQGRVETVLHGLVCIASRLLNRACHRRRASDAAPF